MYALLITHSRGICQSKTLLPDLNFRIFNSLFSLFKILRVFLRPSPVIDLLIGQSSSAKLKIFCQF